MGASIRTRQLRSGDTRHDVRYRDPVTGRQVRRAFTDPGAAQALRDAVDGARLDHIRWPLQPLLAPTGVTARAFARRHGINPTTIDQAAAEGLTDRQADRWATRAGYHPACIWGAEWIDAGLHASEIHFPDAGEAVA